MFENIEPYQIIFLILAVAYFAFMAGRASAGVSAEPREARAQRRAMAAEQLFAALTPEQQAGVDAIIREGRTIEAIKQVREYSGSGLKESKEAIDWRRSQLRP